MTPVDDVELAGLDLIGKPLDDIAPTLVIRSVRRLARGELQDLVQQGLEGPELLGAGVLALEVTFELGRQRWAWRLGLDQEDLPGASEDMTIAEHLRSELTWRLIEWRDTREVRAHAAPRLLRAS